jgi:LysM repeat protein
VQRGDTLSAIGQRFGVTSAAIVFTNEITNPDHLAEGQVLLIPPAPPVQLVVRPAKTTQGRSVRFTLTGAEPSETVTFEIDWPGGAFTGPPHTASSDGKVTASYGLGLADPLGTYTVIARGDQGTTAQATFRVDPAGQ